jgi:O-antigen ligase
MSKFDHLTFSPVADAALEEPYTTETSPAPETVQEEHVKFRAPQPANKLFHYVLLLYVFLYVTRLPELFPSVRISLIASVILLAGAIATARGTAIFSSKVGRILVAFAVWVAICVPFSVWIGGSMDQLKSTVQSVLLVAFIIAFVRTLREVRNLMYTLGLASATVAVLSLSLFRPTVFEGERLGLSESSTLQDPNFMSLYILIGLPFLYLGAMKARGAVRFIFLILIPASLAAIAKSGSRMALILFVIGLLIFLARATQKERFGVIASIAVLVAVTLPVLPQSVVERFTTFFSSRPQQQTDTSEAVESANLRWELLMRSLELTARHPLFGVGPGQFTVGEDILARSEGKRRGIWHFSHNAYTQTSAESGIMGAILYIAALVAAMRGLSGIRKRGPSPLIREMAKYVQLSLWMVILGGFFLTIGFGGVPFIIMGLSVVFQSAVAGQPQKLRAQEATA